MGARRLEIVAVALGDGLEMLVLKAAGRQSFIEELARYARELMEKGVEGDDELDEHEGT